MKFSTENSKLEKSGLIVHTFSIPSGHTCPGACACQAKFDLAKGKLIDGPKQQYRCFSASQEAAFPSLRNARWHNLNLLRKYGGTKREGLATLLNDDLPRVARTVRIHVGGDFYSQAYFDAWLDVAAARPETKFYAYTKSLQFWVQRLHDIPPNLVLTASRGGKFDSFIQLYGLKEAVVVSHPEEALALGIEIDHDDTKAMTRSVAKSALLIHGGQPTGSDAAAALKRLRAEAVAYSYSRARKGGAT